MRKGKRRKLHHNGMKCLKNALFLDSEVKVFYVRWGKKGIKGMGEIITMKNNIYPCKNTYVFSNF